METKIIKAVFGGGRYAVTTKRTRTDYGQVLEFVGVDLPDTFECIFSNSATSAGVGKKQIGSAQRVLIPDEYLATGQTIYAWVLVHDSEDDGRHMYNVKIPVDDMPDTSPEEPTPVEQSVISQAITALNTSVDTTTQKAQEASESADRAEQAAEGVEGYAERAEAAQNASESARDRAVEAETSARTSAATASEKASEAISSATTASQSALTAETASESAQASADASYQNARTAYRYAQDSATSAGQAESYASGAGIYASDAQTHSQTASQKALEASQSAQTATQAKTDAESAKTASETAQTASESARDEAVSAKTDAESARDEAQEIANGITGKVEQIDSNTERIESLEDDRYKPYPTDFASGSIASFPDGADGIPLKSCIVQVEPVQEGSGDPSPDNVRPITGWTGCEVQRTGVNVWDEEWENGTFYLDTGKKQNAPSYWRSKNMISVKPLQTYYFMTSGDSTWRFMYDENKQYVGYLTGISNNSWQIPANVHYINIVDVLNSAYDPLTKPISINYPATDTDYHAYSGQTYPITFPSEAGTVYGGHVDVLNGELVVDRAMDSFNGTEEWDIFSTDKKRIAMHSLLSHQKMATPTSITQMLSNSIPLSVYSEATSRDDDIMTCCGTTYLSRNLYIFVPPTMFTTTDALKAYLAQSPLQVIYPLATPIHYPLTSTQINSLYGQNNLWANTGNSEVEYRADTKLYIEKLTQPEEYDMIADSAINRGQFFMVGNSLYRALANIASGATITVGTNAERVSLSDALNLVNA